MTRVTSAVINHPRDHFMLVSKPSSSNGAAFSGQLDIRLVIGNVGPVVLSLSGCFIGHRSAPHSRGNS